jgi:hypothetical protein
LIDQRAAAAQASTFPGRKDACISIRRASPRSWALFSKAAGVYVCKSRVVKQWGQDNSRFEGARSTGPGAARRPRPRGRRLPTAHLAAPERGHRPAQAATGWDRPGQAGTRRRSVSAQVRNNRALRPRAAAALAWTRASPLWVQILWRGTRRTRPTTPATPSFCHPSPPRRRLHFHKRLQLAIRRLGRRCAVAAPPVVAMASATAHPAAAQRLCPRFI